MTISSENNRNDYTGNGALDTYSYLFKIASENDLKVTQRNLSDVETTLVLNTDYTVTGVGAAAGGTIVLTAGNLTSGFALTIRRDSELKQETDIRNQGDFYPETHEDVFDHLMSVDQTQQVELDRSIKIPETYPNVSTELPGPVADKVLKWNSAGTALTNVDPGDATLNIPADDSVTGAKIDDAALFVFPTMLSLQKGADVASASALTLGVDGNYFDVTGTTAITSIATKGVGTQVILQFDGALTLTHHATDLVLPGAANITTAAGDHAYMVEYALGKWHCINYTRADGLPVLTVFPDNLFSISDNSDATKKLAFECSGFTTGNTRTMTFPDADTTFDYGTYTPTLANETNFVSATARPAFYTRIGNIVTVTGQIVSIATTATGFTRFSATLPISSDLGSYWDLGGGGGARYLLNAPGAILIEGDPTTDLAYISFDSTSTTGTQLSYTFSYEVI